MKKIESGNLEKDTKHSVKNAKIHQNISKILFKKEKLRFVLFLVIFETAMVFCFIFLVKNGQNDYMLRAAEKANNGTVTGRDYLIESKYKEGDSAFDDYYKVYIDIALMAFVGFSLLMSFYRKHGYFAMGMVFLVTCFCSQFGVLVFGYLEKLAKIIKGEDYGHYWVVFDLPLAINALWIGDSALITMGVVIGKVSPFQLVFIGLFETVFYSINTFICAWLFGVIDDGGTILIHTFGAYFGVFCGWMLVSKKLIKNPKIARKNETSYYVGNILSILGTVFLFVFWPSFNCALNIEDRHRTVINTITGLTGSCLAAFCVSKLCRKKFSPCDIQNATIAGGVAVGAIASLPTPIGFILLIGIAAGIVSILGYRYIQPLLEKIYLHDSCGVNNLHGMPGIIGAVASIFAVFEVTNTDNGYLQPLIQLISILITLGIAISSGLFVGGITKLFGFCKEKNPWDDHDYFSDTEENDFKVDYSDHNHHELNDHHDLHHDLHDHPEHHKISNNNTENQPLGEDHALDNNDKDHELKENEKQTIV